MMRSRIPLAVPVDEQAARTARRRAAYGQSLPQPDTTLWAGILFWLGFAALAIIAGI